MVAFGVLYLVGGDAGFANVEPTLLSFAKVHPLFRRLATRVALEFSAFV
jgi:hypothetical protein